MMTELTGTGVSWRQLGCDWFLKKIMKIGICVSYSRMKGILLK